MLEKLLTPNVNGVIDNVINDVKGGLSTAVFGVPFSQKCRIVSLTEGKVLFIAKSATEAKN